MAVRKISPDELKKILENHKLWMEVPLDGQQADLSGADLSRADLNGADLRGANLMGADLREADLREGDLREGDLRGANLREADLREADLRLADLRGANLMGANLRGADLRGADLMGADLMGADLNGVIGLEGIVSTQQTTRSEKEFALDVKQNKIKQLEKELKETKGNTQDKELKKATLNKIKKEESNQEKALNKVKIVRVKTDKAIDEALTALEHPNSYIDKEIKYQRILFWIYAALSALTLIGGILYEIFTYKCALTEPGGKSDTLILIVYIGPIVLMLSLLGTFISLLNKSLKIIQTLKEKEREVKRLGGALKAISILSQTDSERVERINTILDHMADSLSNSPVIPESKRESEKEYSSQSVGILNEIVKLKDQVSKLAKGE